MLKELHWLPVTQRVQYKVAVITHKVLSTRQPLYLADIIKEHRPTRRLRSSTQNLLAIRKTNTRLAERAFNISSAARPVARKQLQGRPEGLQGRPEELWVMHKVRGSGGREVPQLVQGEAR